MLTEQKAQKALDDLKRLRNDERLQKAFFDELKILDLENSTPNRYCKSNPRVTINKKDSNSYVEIPVEVVQKWLAADIAEKRKKITELEKLFNN